MTRIPEGIDRRRAWPSGSETMDALEFLACLVAHIPDTGQVVQRYKGQCASRTGCMGRKATAGEHRPVVYAEFMAEALR